MIYLPYWNEKASIRIGNYLFSQMQYHSPSRQNSFIQMRNLSLINDRPFVHTLAMDSTIFGHLNKYGL